MALWCRDLRTVQVPVSDVPKRLTLVVPYYENPGFFARQLAQWASFNSDLRAHLTVIVVDDGSPVTASLPASTPCAMRLFRIEVDVRWNWLAARNIGAYHAENGWLLLTDMDHMLPADTLRAVLYGVHDASMVYAFHRREHTGEVVSPHSASFLMTRETFWRIGGYDETLSGYYGTDGDYRRLVAQHARMALLPDALIRYEYDGDSSTARYQRKQPEDARVHQLVASRRPGWTPKTLSFPYHEVTAMEACA